MKWTLLLVSICTIKTLAAQNYETEIYVAKDGTGDFTTIQAAINATKAFPDVPIKIFIEEGVYPEKVRV